MNETVSAILAALVPGVVIAIVTAFITVRLSLRQFREERRWEKKYEAYEKIMESLFRILDYDQRLFASWEHGSEIPEELKKKLEEKSSAGWEEVKRALYIGGFIISNDSVKCLKELGDKLDEAEKPNIDYITVIDDRILLVKKYIELFRYFAMRDLSLDPGIPHPVMRKSNDSGSYLH